MLGGFQAANSVSQLVASGGRCRSVYGSASHAELACAGGGGHWDPSSVAQGQAWLTTPREVTPLSALRCEAASLSALVFLLGKEKPLCCVTVSLDFRRCQETQLPVQIRTT